LTIITIVVVIENVILIFILTTLSSQGASLIRTPLKNIFATMQAKTVDSVIITILKQK
jgi:hypothetical protein